MTATQLTCPKCRGAMSSYERSGIVVDQCTDCRGIFLDRGELERLIDLASRDVEPPSPSPVTPSPGTPGAPPMDPQWTGQAPDRAWRQQQPQARDYQQRKHDWDDDSDDRYRSYGGSKYKKRKSFLSDLLDF